VFKKNLQSIFDPHKRKSMNSPTLNIKAGLLFPWQFLVIGALMMIGGLSFIPTKPMVAGVLLLAGAFIVTAREGTEIDGLQKRYREYTTFFFLFKKGAWKSFPAAEKVFLNAAKVTSQVHTAHTNHSATFKNTEYNGYLKLADGTKLHLLTHRKKEKLVRVLQNVASFLKIPFQDNTLT
jgi:hypothetical protein